MKTIQSSKYLKLLISVILLLIGGLIYLLFRSDSLLMFDFIRNISVWDNLLLLRSDLIGIKLPTWVIFNLPCFLWLLSYLILVDVIWDSNLNLWSAFWYFGIPVLAVGSELMQLFNIIPGTYDIYDLISYILAIGIFYNLFLRFDYEK